MGTTRKKPRTKNSGTTKSRPDVTQRGGQTAARGKSRGPNKAVPLDDVIDVSRRYQRSVHLERDLANAEALDGYQLTPAGLKTLERILAGLNDPKGSRAWTLTGPYGSGKSSFLVFLASLLAGKSNNGDAAKAAARLLRETSPDLAKRVVGRSTKAPTLIPLVLTAERAPLDLLLVRGLHNGMFAIWDHRRGRKPVVLDSLEEALEKAESGGRIATWAVVELVEESIDAVRQADIADGLLFVMDEAGKALEYAAHHPTKSDVLVLQELAELAARSIEVPFVFITVFHQAFSGYAARLGAAQRNEWEKVQGRFEDLPFLEGWDQTVRLVASAIERSRKLPQRTAKMVASEVDQALAAVHLPAVLAGPDVPDQLAAAYPLHPYATLLLGPLFRSGVFQNERSLFAFLASKEPGGLQDFAHRHEVSGNDVPFFTLSELFDYVMAVLDSRGSHGRGATLQAASIALRRVPDGAGPLGIALVKTIALLSWLGDKVGLTASPDVLQAALSSQSARDKDELESSLLALQRASIITFRRFRSSYVLWEGSDLQLDALIANAPSREMNAVEAAAALNRLVPQSPIVARRHLFESGTLRYFPVRFIAADDLDEALADDVRQGDGEVLVVVARTASERDYAEKILSGPQHVLQRNEQFRPMISVLPEEADRLLDLLGEYAALDQLGEVEPSFVDDPVAQREVSARKTDIGSMLRAEVSGMLGMGSTEVHSRWFAGGREKKVDNPRAASALVSDTCDKAYCNAPRILNELLNRSDLSSSAASARRNLLEGMIERPHEENLGIEGYPPEMSMYLSVLREHGIHERDQGDTWALKEPRGNARSRQSRAELYPLWEAWTEFCRSQSGMRRSLLDLYQVATRPPFGIKNAVIPVLFMHFYLLNTDSLAVYEQGEFVPKLTSAVMERFLKSPKTFEVQWQEVGATRSKLLHRVGEQLSIAPAAGESTPTVLQILRKLAHTVKELPAYSMSTKRLSPKTLQVREALRGAKEPSTLMFKQLPQALGLQAFPEKQSSGREQDVTAFAEGLAASLTELEQAYTELLLELERRIATALGVEELTDDALRQTVAERSARILPLAVGTRLKSFLVRAVDDTMTREDWIVSLATGLGHKPPLHWNDGDLDVFRTELLQVARLFRETEGLAIAAEDDGLQAEAESTKGQRLLRIGVAELGEASRERVGSLTPREVEVAQHLERSMTELLDSHRGELTGDTRLAIVATVARSLIRELDEAGMADEDDTSVSRRGKTQ